MRTILLDVYKNEVKEIDIAPELDAYYKNLDCSFFDIVHLKIGGTWFDIMCDEEGLYREDHKISAVNSLEQPMIVGNLMFFHIDEEGELTGLSEEDVSLIRSCIQIRYTRNHPEGYCMLTQCDSR